MRTMYPHLFIALLCLAVGCPSTPDQAADQPSAGSGGPVGSDGSGTGDDLVGPPAPTSDPSDPNEPNEPNEPTAATDSVTMTVSVVFADTGAPASGAVVTVRSLLPFEPLCNQTTGPAGSVICDAIPVGRALTITATTVGDFGESLTGRTQFTPLPGFGSQRSVVVPISP